MKGKIIALTILVILCLCLAAGGTALAMSSLNYQLPWQSVSAGGGSISSENYTLSDTIGQPSAIGSSESGNYSLEAGFWYGAALLTAEEPIPSGVTNIADIWADPAAYEGQTVTVTGEYRGWESGSSAPPVTRSDWVIQDDTGSIYVTGSKLGLRHADDIGKMIRVKGVVRLKDGQPYIQIE